MVLFAITDAWDVAGLVLTVVGFVLTLLSLWYAIVQVRKTASAAEAARSAAEATLIESRRTFQRYELAQVLRYMNEARLHVEARDWPRAAIRLSDLGDRAAQLANLSPEWPQLAHELRRWADDFSRFVPGATPKYPTRKWKELLQRLQVILDVSHGPFTT